MSPTLVLLLSSLPACLVSFFGTLFWLAIPLLLQVIVDKVLLQHSGDTLNILGLALLTTSLLASGLEVGLNSLTAFLLRSHLVLKESMLRLAVLLPRVLILGSVLFMYSPRMASIAAALTAVACGAEYFFNRLERRQPLRLDPLPLTFRLPLTLIILFVLWYGAQLVLAGEITVGQWLAMGLFSLELAACLLNYTGMVFGGSKSFDHA